MRSRTRSQLLAGCWVLALSALAALAAARRRLRPGPRHGVHPAPAAERRLGRAGLDARPGPSRWTRWWRWPAGCSAARCTGRIALAGAAAGRPAGAATRLLRLGAALPALLVGAGLAVWNPYVVERLALGQWALLWAYGALPWLVRAAHRLPDRTAPGCRPSRALLGWLAGCAITPTGALIGAGVAVGGWPVAGSWPAGAGAGRRGAGAAAVAAAGAAVRRPRRPATRAAVAAFAARSERPGGALLSLLGLGGIWSADVTPASRAGLLGYLTTAGWCCWRWLLGLPVLRAGCDGCAGRLVALARPGCCWRPPAAVPGLAGGAALGGPRAARRRPAPGRAEVADALRAAGDSGCRRRGASGWPAASSAGWPAAGLPLAVLLAIARGVAAAAAAGRPGHPAAHRWPRCTTRPAGGRSPADGARAPARRCWCCRSRSYRSFAWAPGRTVLDPAPRWLPADDGGRRPAGGRRAALLAGEDPAAAGSAALLQGQPGAGGAGRRAGRAGHRLGAGRDRHARGRRCPT